MSLKGTFERRMMIQSRVGGVAIYSFTLSNTDWFGSETFDSMLCDGAGLQPRFYRGLKLKAGESMRFDYETVGWSWCQGDFFAILGRKDKIEKSWPLNLKEYRPGECPECHGTRKCSHCKGQGYSFVFQSGLSSCPYCGGTGVCQTCNVPRRTPTMTVGSAYPPNGGRRRHRPAAVIQNDIMDVQRQIDQIEWNWKMRDLGRSPNVGYGLKSSEIQLRYTLQQRLSKLQEELRNAYNG